jgi:hypothetical protein
MTKYNYKWIGSAKWTNCDKACPFSVVNYIVPSCIMQPKVDKLGLKLKVGDLSSLQLNFFIFSHKLDKGLTYQRCDRSSPISVITSPRDQSKLQLKMEIFNYSLNNGPVQHRTKILHIRSQVGHGN